MDNKKLTKIISLHEDWLEDPSNGGQANLEGANLVYAELRGSNLTGVNLAGANLAGANLTGADLEGVNLTRADLERIDLATLGGWCLPPRDVPYIPNIHQNLYKAVSRANALDMSKWHSACGATHCLAGWIITLGGDQGRELEATASSTAVAAYQIYYQSDKFGLLGLGSVDFYTEDSEKVLQELQRLAELEKGKVDELYEN